MKVHELITELQKMPQNMEVFIYSEFGECDEEVDKVMICNGSSPEDTEKRGEPFIEEYYCHGLSFAGLYLDRHKDESQVVVIGTF